MSQEYDPVYHTHAIFNWPFLMFKYPKVKFWVTLTKHTTQSRILTAWSKSIWHGPKAHHITMWYTITYHLLYPINCIDKVQHIAICHPNHIACPKNDIISQEWHHVPSMTSCPKNDIMPQAWHNAPRMTSYPKNDIMSQEWHHVASMTSCPKNDIMSQAWYHAASMTPCPKHDIMPQAWHHVPRMTSCPKHDIMSQGCHYAPAQGAKWCIFCHSPTIAASHVSTFHIYSEEYL